MALLVGALGALLGGSVDYVDDISRRVAGGTVLSWVEFFDKRTSQEE